MATLTKEQYNAIRGGNNPSYSQPQKEIKADTFVGDLKGNADTATRLREAITLSLGGDVDGSVQINSEDTRLNVTVKESAHAVNADKAENAKRSASSSLADLANIATLALQCLSWIGATVEINGKVIEQATGTVKDGKTLSLTIDELNTVIGTFILDTWKEEDPHKTNKIYVDTVNNTCHIYIQNKWVDIFGNTETHLKKLQGTSDNHEDRLITAEGNIQSIDKRVTDIETSTDVGKLTVRVVNIEDKNTEQDNRLEAIEKNVTTLTSTLDNVNDIIKDTFVTLSTAQYVRGVKDFLNGSLISIPEQADDRAIINKGYVDKAITQLDTDLKKFVKNADDTFMTLSSAQYVNGLKDFGVLPQSETAPTDNKDLVTKQYVDSTFVNQTEQQTVTGQKDFNVITCNSLVLNGYTLTIEEESANA